MAKASKTEVKKYRLMLWGSPLTTTSFRAFPWDGKNWLMPEHEKKMQYDTREANGTIIVDTAGEQQTARPGDWIVEDTQHKLRVATRFQASSVLQEITD